LKYIIGLRSCSKTTPILIPDASHSISNAFVKSGKAKTGAEHIFSFKRTKANYCSFPHLNPTDFLTTSFKGAAIVLKSFTKRL
jgi:hypothetical protein